MKANKLYQSFEQIRKKAGLSVYQAFAFRHGLKPSLTQQQKDLLKQELQENISLHEQLIKQVDQH